MPRPQPNEAAPYYFNYINLISDEDIIPALEKQLTETHSFFKGISEEQSLHCYSPDKWTIRQVLGHLNDTERVFLYRALWFARGFPESLPSFDQNVAVGGSSANDVLWSDHVEEFRNIRLATLSFFKNLPESAWSRTGVASDNSFTVRSLAYIIAGHTAHHEAVLKERYLSH